mmetsp:Transcript_16799/g.29086  ORF Transcript_16799/g.29086 Transcript_16799/m.29086 type:complete len:301 (-) Transcript_16799:84-986(-)|eukprot:CAMPEP_0196667082 /NCGR_PEP_ID=MMETSP1086-20130531/64881_1 /TAXON_ID=77921 /ORGANISM="Cyanoptyche  gloeocystis , Strain SAG4.97" /LENGTH=300 /DNA_ID=CAMNT_0042004371 /DNA_START=62 /DNA_END=964 /DNA_ORIENTATION=-
MAFSIPVPGVIKAYNTKQSAHICILQARITSTLRSSQPVSRRFKFVKPNFPSTVSPVFRPVFTPVASQETIDVSSTTVTDTAERTALKAQFLSLVAGTNRGLFTSSEERSVIDGLIAELEFVNPTLKPTESLDLLQGSWRLVYTNSLDVILLGRIPVVQLAEVFQNVDGLKFENIAEIAGLPPFDAYSGTKASFSVVASAEVVSPIRLQIRFEKASLRAQKFLGNSLSFLPPLSAQLPASSNAETYLDTTYLDEDMRIARGIGSSVFVLSKVSGPAIPPSPFAESTTPASTSAPKEIQID